MNQPINIKHFQRAVNLATKGELVPFHIRHRAQMVHASYENETPLHIEAGGLFFKGVVLDYHDESETLKLQTESGDIEDFYYDEVLSDGEVLNRL